MSNIVGIDVNSGEVLWKYGGWGCSIPIPDAVPIGDGRFFITGGYRAGSAMFKVEKREGKFATGELFKLRMPSSQIHIPLLYKDHLYINSNSNEASDGMVCLDLSGKIKWQTRAKPNFERGNLLPGDCKRLFGSLRNLARRLAESIRNHPIRPEAIDTAYAAAIQIRLDSS